MPLVPFDGHSPIIGNRVFIAPDAWITGKVEIGDQSSLFFGSVIRGDIQRIVIGTKTNVQEHTVIHTSKGLKDCIIGNRVTIGHRSILHGCTIANNCIIGMGSIILDGASIDEESIIGAHSLITMDSAFPPRSLIFGSPAKAVRPLTIDEINSIHTTSESYLKVASQYRKYFDNTV